MSTARELEAARYVFFEAFARLVDAHTNHAPYALPRPEVGEPARMSALAYTLGAALTSFGAGALECVPQDPSYSDREGLLESVKILAETTFTTEHVVVMRAMADTKRSFVETELLGYDPLEGDECSLCHHASARHTKSTLGSDVYTHCADCRCTTSVPVVPDDPRGECANKCGNKAIDGKTTCGEVVCAVAARQRQR